MKIKLTLIVILFLTLILLSGCWDSVELGERAIVAAVGVDKGLDDEIILTVQIINSGQLSSQQSGGNGSSGAPVLVATTSGKTVFQAIRDFTKQVSKKLYFEQNRILVFSEEIAKEGILPYIDLFMRDYEFRKRSWILVTHEKASDIIKAGSELSNIPANEILDLLDAQFATSEAAREDLFHLAIKLASDTTCPIATHIGTHSGNGEGETETEEIKYPLIIGTAAFRNDIFQGYLNNQESRGYLWITNGIESGIIVVKSPEDNSSYISIEIRASNTKMKAILENGKPVIEISIETEASVGDVGSELDLTDLEVFKKLEDKCKDSIKKEIQACLLKAQKRWGTDIFGFGETVYNYFPQEWKEIKDIWLTEVYSSVDVSLDIKVSVVRSGLLTKPIRD